MREKENREGSTERGTEKRRESGRKKENRAWDMFVWTNNEIDFKNDEKKRLEKEK